MLAVLYECILLFEVKTIGIEIFGKGIRVHLLYHIPAAQRGGNLARKHFGVASGDIYIIFMVCQTAGKLFPTLHKLYFIEEKDRAVIIHLFVAHLNEFEIAQLQRVNTVVFKIKEENLLAAVPAFDELRNPLVHQVRLARMAQANHYVVLPVHEVHPPLYQLHAGRKLLVFCNKLFH